MGQYQAGRVPLPGRRVALPSVRRVVALCRTAGARVRATQPPFNLRKRKADGFRPDRGSSRGVQVSVPTSRASCSFLTFRPRILHT
jgi:hypothetical protein